MKTLTYLLMSLLFFIPPAVAIRVIICRILMVTDPDQEDLYRRRANNAIIFAVIAEIVTSVLFLVRDYLS